ncbi:MAG: transcriptional regulator [Thaumarchaeota archaeon]|nr:transcriptional regulator [Nitrososphaerota archaeon]
MASYRTQVRIIADVLRTAKDNGNDGVGITVLLRRANLSYTRLLKIVSTLVASGLMEEVVMEKTSRYKISNKGVEFLQAYGHFEEFARSFGLGL